jgi:ABC-type lipoprotein export system ATPase subunit
MAHPSRPVAIEGAPPFIDIRNLTKVYLTPAGSITAVDHVNLRVRRGELVAVMGRSGSGKSTLLNLVTGIDRPTGGELSVDGVAIHTLSEMELTEWRGQNVGIVFQFFQLMPTLTLLENVILPMELNRSGSPEGREQRALRLLERVGMAQHRDRLPSTVSGGEPQRIAIARALANDPPLIVADEPTGNLDTQTAESIMHLFVELVADGKTLMLMTHDQDLARRAPRMLLIADGHLSTDI